MNHAPHLSVEEIHLALLQAVPEGMCFTDLHGAVRFWNDTAEAIGGFSVAEAVCARHADDVFFLSGLDGQPASLPSVADGTYFLRHKDGHYLPVVVRRVPVQIQSDQPLGVLYLFSIPENAAARAETRREGPSEPRPAWLQDESQEIYTQWAHQGVRPAGILLIQIDNFDQISQRLGPEATEKLSELVERTTAHSLRDGDSYRCLPDGVVLASLSAAQNLTDLAERIRGLIQSARIQWWGEMVTITASMGLTEVHSHDTVADAIGRAEDCVIRARADGGNRVVRSEA